MYIKLIGAVIVIGTCGGFGFKIANEHRTEERMLRQITALLDYMECELQYRLTPLPQLCRQASEQATGTLSKIFLRLSQELGEHITNDVSSCVERAIAKTDGIPYLTKAALEQLGQTLGRFDIDGQLKGLEAVRQECRRNIDSLNKDKESRLRSYQTLGLCAGAALAILFL